MADKRHDGLRLYEPGSLKKGPSWYIRGTYRGVEVYRSARTGRRQDAERIRREIEREIEDGSYQSGDGEARTAFSEAALVYLRGCPIKQVPYVKRLLEFYKDRPLEDFKDPAVIEEVVYHFYPDGPAPRDKPSARNATINRNIITPLAAILHMAARRNLMPWVRVQRYREKSGGARAETPETVERLLEALPPDVTNNRGRTRYPRAAARFMFGTGARLGEAIQSEKGAPGLDWKQVDLQRRHVTLLDTKNGETYGVHLHAAVFDELARLPHRDGQVFGYNDRWEFYKDWYAACEEIGLEDFNPHCARHTYATWHRQLGQDLKALMSLGRWKSLESVKRYAHVSVDEQIEAIDALPMAPKNGHDRENPVKNRRGVA